MKRCNICAWSWWGFIFTSCVTPGSVYSFCVLLLGILLLLKLPSKSWLQKSLSCREVGCIVFFCHLNQISILRSLGCIKPHSYLVHAHIHLLELNMFFMRYFSQFHFETEHIQIYLNFPLLKASACCSKKENNDSSWTQSSFSEIMFVP